MKAQGGVERNQFYLLGRRGNPVHHYFACPVSMGRDYIECSQVIVEVVGSSKGDIVG